MRTYKLVRKQVLPITKYRAWNFFSSPRNLALVIPSRLDLEILAFSDTDRIYQGQILRHRVTVLPFVRIDWHTEVQELIYYECFTLRQRKGPYAHWVHKHRFNPVPGGVEMSDDIEYAIPVGGWTGQVITSLFVKPELNKIFNYRAKVIEEYFGVTIRSAPSMEITLFLQTQSRWKCRQDFSNCAWLKNYNLIQ